MIKKEKDQKQERFSKERYVQDYEKWFSERDSKKNHQRQVQEISHELKKINRSLENFEKDCAYCNYKGTYSIHVEPNLDEFEAEIEKDIAEVICVRPDVDQKEVFNDETEKIPAPKTKDPSDVRLSFNFRSFKQWLIKNEILLVNSEKYNNECKTLFHIYFHELDGSINRLEEVYRDSFKTQHFVDSLQKKISYDSNRKKMFKHKRKSTCHGFLRFLVEFKIRKVRGYDYKFISTLYKKHLKNQKLTIRDNQRLEDLQARSKDKGTKVLKEFPSKEQRFIKRSRSLIDERDRFELQVEQIQENFFQLLDASYRRFKKAPSNLTIESETQAESNFKGSVFKDLKIARRNISKLNRNIWLKQRKVPSPYHDMDSKVRYQECQYQNYRKEQGFDYDYAVVDKLLSITGSNEFLKNFVELKYRERFNEFFKSKPGFTDLLQYSSNLDILKIVQNQDKWILALEKERVVSKQRESLVSLLSEASKSILIFEILEKSYREKIDRFFSDNELFRTLIPRNLYLNLIELSANKKLIKGNFQFWQMDKGVIIIVVKLLRKISNSYKILKLTDPIDLAKLYDYQPKLENFDEKVAEKEAKEEEKIQFERKISPILEEIFRPVFINLVKESPLSILRLLLDAFPNGFTALTLLKQMDLVKSIFKQCGSSSKIQKEFSKLLGNIYQVYKVYYCTNFNDVWLSQLNLSFKSFFKKDAVIESIVLSKIKEAINYSGGLDVIRVVQNRNQIKKQIKNDLKDLSKDYLLRIRKDLNEVSEGYSKIVKKYVAEKNRLVIDTHFLRNVNYGNSLVSDYKYHYKLLKKAKFPPKEQRKNYKNILKNLSKLEKQSKNNQKYEFNFIVSKYWYIKRANRINCKWLRSKILGQ